MNIKELLEFMQAFPLTHEDMMRLITFLATQEFQVLSRRNDSNKEYAIAYTGIVITFTPCPHPHVANQQQYIANVYTNHEAPVYLPIAQPQELRKIFLDMPHDLEIYMCRLNIQKSYPQP